MSNQISQTHSIEPKKTDEADGTPDFVTKIAFAVGALVSVAALICYFAYGPVGHGKGIGYVLAIPGIVTGGIVYGVLRACLPRKKG